MEVSPTKSYCLASTSRIGDAIARRMSPYGLRHKARVVSLGAGLAAGTRRNAAVMTKRLKAFQRRAPRFRKLAKVGVCTKRILRTGGWPA